MLTATRLRNVLTTFETSNPFAKYLLQRITVFGCTFNKEYAALQLSPNVTSLSSIMTLLLKSLLPPETTSTNTPRDSQTTGPVNETSIVLRNQAKHENLLTQATTTLSQAPSGTSNSTPSAGGTGSSQREFTDVNRIEVNQFEEQVKMSEINMKEAACTVIVPEQDSPKEGAVCNGSICGSVSEPHASGSDTKEKPCFKSSMADILRFMELVGNLKHTKRTGWVLRDVNDCESISGHMYRMSIMTFLLDGSEGLNQIRCMELALVHDLAESLVGDLTPFCGVAKEEKKAMELKAMEDICKLIEPRGKRIMELFEEYEAGKSAESKFVKDLDRLDMVMQAFEYEKRDDCLMKHQEFFDSTEGKFGHPFIKKLVEEINNQRKILVEAKSVSNGNIKLKTVTPNCPPCLEHKNERS